MDDRRSKLYYTRVADVKVVRELPRSYQLEVITTLGDCKLIVVPKSQTRFVHGELTVAVWLASHHNLTKKS